MRGYMSFLKVEESGGNMKVMIRDTVGARCMVPEDGQKIHDMIAPALKSGDDVYLDFSGVNLFASPFFNFAIGQLLNDVPVESVRRLLHLEQINDVGKLVVERVISNASAYHGNEDYQKIVDQILEKQAGGAN
jgi:hypothetical protein